MADHASAATKIAAAHRGKAARAQVVSIRASRQSHSEPNPEPELQEGGAAGLSHISAEPLSAKQVKKGLAVQLIKNPSMTGTVLLKAGKNAKVNFSGSGDTEDQWIPCVDLQLAGAVAERTAEDTTNLTSTVHPREGVAELAADVAELMILTAEYSEITATAGEGPE
eukprot:COSAG02_NODE_24687_length_680_cov_1.067126_1_plen_166_part_10